MDKFYNEKKYNVINENVKNNDNKCNNNNKCNNKNKLVMKVIWLKQHKKGIKDV